jgi:hypothetical protein
MSSVGCRRGWGGDLDGDVDGEAVVTVFRLIIAVAGVCVGGATVTGGIAVTSVIGGQE